MVFGGGASPTANHLPSFPLHSGATLLTNPLLSSNESCWVAMVIWWGTNTSLLRFLSFSFSLSVNHSLPFFFWRVTALQWFQWQMLGIPLTLHTHTHTQGCLVQSRCQGCLVQSRSLDQLVCGCLWVEIKIYSVCVCACILGSGSFLSHAERGSLQARETRGACARVCVSGGTERRPLYGVKDIFCKYYNETCKSGEMGWDLCECIMSVGVLSPLEWQSGECVSGECVSYIRPRSLSAELAQTCKRVTAKLKGRGVKLVKGDTHTHRRPTCAE